MARVSGWNGLLLGVAWSTEHSPVGPSAGPPRASTTGEMVPLARDACPAQLLRWGLSPWRGSPHGQCQLSSPPARLDKEASPHQPLPLLAPWASLPPVNWENREKYRCLLLSHPVSGIYYSSLSGLRHTPV